MTPSDTSCHAVIIIPARMASSRLPGKPLADIAGKPMIVHVMEQAKKSGIGDVIVACAEQEIADVITNYGGQAVLTDPNHHSGTDRIYEAYQLLDKPYDYIINVQGDLPNIQPDTILDTYHALTQHSVDITTLASVITEEEEIHDPNVVKVVFSSYENNTTVSGYKEGKALYFSRNSIPYGEGEHYHHIGIYGYKREALERFVALPPSPLEKREKLEQLRALENGMNIGVTLVDAMPLGVDTPDDLQKMRAFLTTIQ